MAHVIKDSMNHYAIEITRGTKNVQCLIRFNGEVEFKTFPIHKPIVDKEYHTDDGTHLYDKRWVPCTPETDPGCVLDRVLDSFQNSELSITDKARRMMEALRANPNAVVPVAAENADSISTNEGEATMSTKKTKTKKAPKAKAPKAPKAAKAKIEKGYKGHRNGSRKETMHKFMDEKKPERQEFIAHAEKLGLTAGTASSWYQSFKK